MNRLFTTIVASVLALSLAGCGGGSDTAADSTTTVAPSGPELKIMPLGDSITAADRVPGGYRTELAGLLTAQGDRFQFVGSQNDPNAPEVSQTHEGHNGFWIENLGEQTETWLAAGQPQIILLMAGTNDVVNGEGASAPARLQTLIDSLLVQAPGSSVIVSSIPTLVGFEDAVTQYNQAIPGVVQALSGAGKPVTFVDGGSAFSVSDLADDGIHPSTQESYDAMAAVWAPATQAIFATAKAAQS